MAGCGGSDPAPTQATGTQNATSSTGGGDNSTNATTKTNATTNTSAPSGKPADDRKTVGGIPYDVFFDDPFQVAATQGTVVAAAPTAPMNDPGGTTEEPAEATTEVAPAGGGTDWEKIVPAEVLEGEVKRIRNRLKQYMQGVANFRQNIFQLPADAATLAVLAQIATNHPGDISWKDNAKYIRDLAYAMVEGDLKPDKGTFDAVSEPYENLVDILNGNIPPGLEDNGTDVAFPEIADFGYLMKRLDRGEKWAKTNCGSEDGFMDEEELARAEGHIIAALAKVIESEDYGYADEDFNAHADTMFEGGLKMATGSGFEDFDVGMNMVSKKCAECHTEYRE